MSRRIIHVRGIGYSGNSLLNLLLDSADGFGGPSETNRFWDGNDDVSPWSIRRRSDDDTALDSRFRDGINPSPFHSEAFDRYDDAFVFADATKISLSLMERRRMEPWFDCHRIMPAKYPHEFAESHCRQNKQTVEEAFAPRIGLTQKYLRHEMPALNFSYRLLMARHDPAGAVAKWLGPGCVLRHEHWRAIDSHLIGGNTAAREQINPHYASHLDNTPKYQGRRGAHFRG